MACLMVYLTVCVGVPVSLHSGFIDCDLQSWERIKQETGSEARCMFVFKYDWIITRRRFKAAESGFHTKGEKAHHKKNKEIK